MKMSKLIATVFCTGILAASAAFAEDNVPPSNPENGVVKQQLKQEKEVVKADRAKLQADRKKLREDKKAARAARKGRRHHEKKPLVNG